MADEMHQLACAALRGECPVWSLGFGERTAADFLAYCGYHGIGPLVYSSMVDSSAWVTWHKAVREGLQAAYRGVAALELLRERETRLLLERFDAQGIEAILLKGTALAFGLYADPALRTRTDTDLLIDPSDKNAAFAILRGLGYEAPNAITGRYVSSQQTFLKHQGGVKHAIDLHWQISNAQVFAQQFPFAELIDTAVPVPALGAAARMLAPTHALLHACLHRAVHIQRGEGDRLQWYFDMHLLAGRLDEPGWRLFDELARAKGLRTVCADALMVCDRLLGTPVPATVAQALADPASHEELSAALLHGNPLKTQLTNYRALPGWRARLHLLREQLLPGTEYMQRRYGVQGHFALGRAYIVRLLNAPARLLSRSKQGVRET